MNQPAQPRPTRADGDVSQNIVWHEHTVTRTAREANLRQRGCVIWFTGLSGCGKSTIANELDRLLIARGAASTILDGDNVRHGLCAPPSGLAAEHGDAFAERFGLGFSPTDREENIRRIGAVASLMAASGLITLAAFVSPYRRDRDRVRRIVESDGQTGDFLEVFVDTPLEVCQQRDPKGLYKKALAGEIANFTGISDPYEAPQNPEIHLQFRDGMTPADAADEILQAMIGRRILST